MAITRISKGIKTAACGCAMTLLSVSFVGCVAGVDYGQNRIDDPKRADDTRSLAVQPTDPAGPPLTPTAQELSPGSPSGPP